jgi:predicted HAD superfamily Cof-like phosphohydrolase
MSARITLDITALWFQRAVPSPTTKNLHTQLGCHFEEVSEMLAALHTNDTLTGKLLLQAEVAMSRVADHFKACDHLIIEKSGETELLDALCDQIVTAVGVGHMFGYEVTDALGEVNASNWSKFVKGEPVFDENKKIQKGPDYFKPDLSPFI